MKKMKKELVVFNTKKGMTNGAKEDAQRWNDAAPMMSSVNAKKPMVVEQSPSGAIMGRATSAKPMSSRGAGTRKAQGAYTNPKSMDSVPVIKRAKKAAPCPECGMEKTMCKCGGMGKGMLAHGMMKRGKKDGVAATSAKLTPAELKNLKDWDEGFYNEYMDVQANKSARAGSLRKEMPPMRSMPPAPKPKPVPDIKPPKPINVLSGGGYDKPRPVGPNMGIPKMPMGKVAKRKSGK